MTTPAGPINGLTGDPNAGINVLDNDELNGVAVDVRTM
jgi:hypothetical protein